MTIEAIHREKGSTNAAKEYPVICAWCLPKGRVTQVNTASVANSHGICEVCKGEVLREAGIAQGAI